MVLEGGPAERAGLENEEGSFIPTRDEAVELNRLAEGGEEGAPSPLLHRRRGAYQQGGSGLFVEAWDRLMQARSIVERRS